MVIPPLKRFQNVPLHLVLIIPFLLQIFAVVGLAGYFSVRNGQRTIGELAQQLEAEVSARVEQQLNDYLSTPQQINELNARAVSIGQIDLNNYPETGRFFWEQMQVFQDVSYIFYALPSGEYAGAGQFLDDGSVTIDERSAATNWKTNIYLTDTNGNRAKRVHQIAQYDPHSEPWYKDAVRVKQPYWSSVHAWTGKPGVLAVSVSYPIYDSNRILQGVVGVDLRLTSIQDFLQELTVSPSGKVFIMERNGRIIATSSNDQPYSLVMNQPLRLNVFNSNDPLIAQTARDLQQTFGNFNEIQDSHALQFGDDDRRYVQVKPWRDQLGLDWLVVTIVPESDFMQQIYANTRTTVLLCLTTLGLATLLGLLTAHRLTQPIRRINQASEAIAAGDLDQEVQVQGVRELNALATTFNQMARQLRESFAVLECTNVELEDRVEERTAELREALRSLQETQAQLVQTEKMSSLGQLVAGVAHEINNPVNFIYGNLVHADRYVQDLLRLIYLYQERYPDIPTDLQAEIEAIDLAFLQEDLPKLLRSTHVGAERIREIVLSLRNFSRLDEAESKTVDIHEGIDSTLMILRNRLKAKSHQPDIRVIKEYRQLPLIECYPGQLNQVIMNLLSNAIDALEEKSEQIHSQSKATHLSKLPEQPDFLPTLYIRTEMSSRHWITIYVADNGSGIPDEIQAKLFDPFFTTKTIGKGTGLGLSISYQIVVERHGGTLTVKSIPNEGAEFAIGLPVKLKQQRS